MLSFIQKTPHRWEIIQSHVIIAGHLIYNFDMQEWSAHFIRPVELSASDIGNISIKIDELNTIFAT